MVVGNGLLAKAFSQYKNHNDILVFASGVSNSKEMDDRPYAREFNLLTTYAGTPRKIIYFSTTSIHDSSIRDSKYTQHKLRVESFIANSFENYVIFRLPIVVGSTTNNNTFFNGFRNAILTDSVYIKKEARRYIIDVDDLAKYLPTIIDRENKVVMDICFNNKASVHSLVRLMGNIMGVDFVEHVEEGGADYTPDNAKFLSYIPSDSVAMTKHYTYIVLNKYLNDNILPTK